MKRGTPDHPKTIMLTMEFEKIYTAHHRKNVFGGKAQAVGTLEVLWEWTSKYAIQGDIGKWSDDVIAKSIGWIFSGKELISALVSTKWLDLAPEPHRLVIHDIKDHATNAWRQNLEDAGLTWWDGSSPRKYKLQKKSRTCPEEVQNLSRRSPQAETKPETETETSKEEPPTPAADAAVGRRRKREPSEFDQRLAEMAQRIHDKHPAKRRVGVAVIAAKLRLIANSFPAIGRWQGMESLERRHAAWCESWDWTKDGGQFAKGLKPWLNFTDGLWREEAPALALAPMRQQPAYVTRDALVHDLFVDMVGAKHGHS